MGDGDNTIPMRGALGLTDAKDDRVFLIRQKDVLWPLGTTDHKMVHADLTNPTESLSLVAQILTGSICSQTQQLTFRSQKDPQVDEIFIDNTRPAPGPRVRTQAQAVDLATADRWLVQVAGAVQVDVTDGRGRHDGPYPDPNYRGIIEQRIPDSTYDGEIITGTGGTDVTTFFVS